MGEPHPVVVLGLLVGTEGFASAQDQVFPVDADVEATGAFVFVEPRQETIASCLEL